MNRQGKLRHGSRIYLVEVLEGKITEKEILEEIIERKCHSNEKREHQVQTQQTTKPHLQTWL